MIEIVDIFKSLTDVTRIRQILQSIKNIKLSVIRLSMNILREDLIMRKIEIFDPAMCCSTGVCGPSIDPELLRVATVVHSLQEKGITIKRHGLSNEPQDFISNQVINDLLQKEGADILPVTLVDGIVVKTKVYPSNDELSEWLNLEINTKQGVTIGGCCGPKRCC